MRQCERARQAVIETTGRPATEQLHLDESKVTACLKHFALDYLQNDLLPHQKDDPAYAIKWKDDGTWSFTSPQRSFINNMLQFIVLCSAPLGLVSLLTNILTFQIQLQLCLDYII